MQRSSQIPASSGKKTALPLTALNSLSLCDKHHVRAGDMDTNTEERLPFAEGHTEQAQEFCLKLLSVPGNGFSVRAAQAGARRQSLSSAEVPSCQFEVSTCR